MYGWEKKQKKTKALSFANPALLSKIKETLKIARRLSVSFL